MNQVLDVAIYEASLRADGHPNRSDWIDYLVTLAPPNPAAGVLQDYQARTILTAPTTTTINFVATDLPRRPIKLYKDGRLAVLDTPIAAGAVTGPPGTYYVYVDLGVSTVSWVFSQTPPGSETTLHRIALGSFDWDGAAITSTPVSYVTADIIAALPAPTAITGERTNLLIVHDATNPAFKVTITADALDIEGNRALAVSLTADLTVSGAGGLDTGSEAANTDYYLWVLRKSSDGSLAAVWSTSATSPALPSGYDQAKLVSHRRNDESSNLIRVVQSNDLVLAESATMVIGISLTGTTDLDMTNFVPAAIADFVSLSLVLTTAGSADWALDDKDDPTIRYWIGTAPVDSRVAGVWVRKNAANLVTAVEISGAQTLTVGISGWKVKVL